MALGTGAACTLRSRLFWAGAGDMSRARKASLGSGPAAKIRNEANMEIRMLAPSGSELVCSRLAQKCNAENGFLFYFRPQSTILP